MVDNRELRPKKRIRVHQQIPRITPQTDHGRRTITIGKPSAVTPRGASTPVTAGIRPLAISLGDERNDTAFVDDSAMVKRRTIEVGKEGDKDAHNTTPVTPAIRRRLINIGNARIAAPVTPASRRQIRINSRNKTPVTPAPRRRTISLGSLRRPYSRMEGWTNMWENSDGNGKNRSNRVIKIRPPASDPRRKFSISTGAKISIAGNPSRTQFCDVKRLVGPLESRMICGREDGVSPLPERPYPAFVDTFLHIPLHSPRVSFRARCCCSFPDSKLRVLVDSDNYFAFIRLESSADMDIDNTPILYNDVQRDDRLLPRSLLVFLLAQAAKLNLLVGEPPSTDHLLASIPVFQL